MNADGVAVESEAFEAGERIFQAAERSHKAAIGAALEIFGGTLRGNGKREGMELFAVLDVLIHIFHDVFGKWRSKKAAMAESAMAKLGRALAPGDDLAAFEMFADFVVELIVAGHIAVDD